MYGSYTYKPKYLEILGTTTKYEHVLQVPLVPPGVLTNNDSQCPTITMTIAMDTAWADRNDHDPSFGISDGKRFIGFIAVEHSTPSPCHLIEGDNVEDVLTLRKQDGSSHKLSSASKDYSSEIKIQIKPCEKCGILSH